MNKQKLIVYKITLSGLLIALSIIFQRFLVIPFGIPSLYRFSLGSLPIMMASIFLGPVYGLIVGVASDLIGSMIVSVGPLLIWPTISAAAYGLLPGLFLMAIKFFNKKIKIPFLYIFLGLLFITVELYIFLNSGVTNYFATEKGTIVFTTTFRVIFTIVFALLLAGVTLATLYLEKRYKGKVVTSLTGLPSELAFALLLSLIIVDILYSSTWKYFAWKIDFFVSVFFHTAIGLILLPIQTSLLIVTARVFERQGLGKELSSSAKSNLPRNEDEQDKND